MVDVCYLGGVQRIVGFGLFVGVYIVVLHNMLISLYSFAKIISGDSFLGDGCLFLLVDHVGYIGRMRVNRIVSP